MSFANVNRRNTKPIRSQRRQRPGHGFKRIARPCRFLYCQRATINRRLDTVLSSDWYPLLARGDRSSGNDHLTNSLSKYLLEG